jgi:hypothetical protein
MSWPSDNVATVLRLRTAAVVCFTVEAVVTVQTSIGEETP